MAPTEETHSGGSGFSLFGWLALTVVVVLWALFGIAMWAAPGALEEVWSWVDGLPMAAKVVVWVVGLPWMAAIAVWQSDWPDPLRLALVVGLAVGSVWTLWPKR